MPTSRDTLLKNLLLEMPAVGEDADSERVEDMNAEDDFIASLDQKLAQQSPD